VTDLVAIPSPGVPLFYGTAGDPVVVVLHDMYGRLPWLDPFATALASKGFRVAVPDLYDGVCTVESTAAHALMDNLDVAAALATVDDAIAQAHVTGDEHVGLVGFSLGGWLSLLHAQSGAADAVVAYYASLADQDHGVIPCPVLLQWAESDDWADGEHPDEFVDRLSEHGTPVTQHTYLGTQHSFANASLAEKLDARSAALAFARTAVFLEKLLAE